MSENHIGNVSGLAVTIGDGSVSEVNIGGSGPAGVEHRLAELRGLLATEHDAFDNPDQVLDDIQELDEALARGDDRGRLELLVKRIREGVGSATHLVNAVDALARAIGGVI
jgi:hypothetical protein